MPRMGSHVVARRQTELTQKLWLDRKRRSGIARRRQRASVERQLQRFGRLQLKLLERQRCSEHGRQRCSALLESTVLERNGTELTSGTNWLRWKRSTDVPSGSRKKSNSGTWTFSASVQPSSELTTNRDSGATRIQ